MRRIVALVALAGGLALAGNVVQAADKDKVDATAKFEAGSVAVGVGYTWGEGTLNYKGKAHKFKVNGLSVADVGVSEMKATATVEDLKKLEDFEGTYVAASAGAAAGEGVDYAMLTNQHGVDMKVTADTKGVKFKLGGDGVKITFVK